MGAKPPIAASIGWDALPHPTITQEPVRSFWLTVDLSKPADTIIRLRPIRRILAPPDCSPERGMRPIDRPCDKPVSDRIEMDIVDTPAKIVGITHRMLPKPALPNPALSLGGAAR